VLFGWIKPIPRGNVMSVKIEWQIFKAETRIDGTWRSSNPALEELLNAIASPEKIKDHTQDIEYSMAVLAIRGLPYFKIIENTSENAGKKFNISKYAKATN
jgi:hypothetical protein